SPRDDGQLDEDVAQAPAIAGVLQRARLVQIGGGDLARAYQPRANRLPVAADGGRHHAPAIEADGARRLAQLRGHPQHTTLPSQIEQLEDVLNVQLLERS